MIYLTFILTNILYVKNSFECLEMKISRNIKLTNSCEIMLLYKDEVYNILGLHIKSYLYN